MGNSSRDKDDFSSLLRLLAVTYTWMHNKTIIPGRLHLNCCIFMGVRGEVFERMKTGVQGYDFVTSQMLEG